MLAHVMSEHISPEGQVQGILTKTWSGGWGRVAWQAYITHRQPTVDSSLYKQQPKVSRGHNSVVYAIHEETLPAPVTSPAPVPPPSNTPQSSVHCGAVCCVELWEQQRGNSRALATAPLTSPAPHSTREVGTLNCKQSQQTNQLCNKIFAQTKIEILITFRDSRQTLDQLIY